MYFVLCLSKPYSEKWLSGFSTLPKVHDKEKVKDTICRALWFTDLVLYFSFIPPHNKEALSQLYPPERSS